MVGGAEVWEEEKNYVRYSPMGVKGVMQWRGKR